MPTLARRIEWLKTNFGPEIDKAITGSPLNRNLVMAVALQETSYIWGGLIDKMSPDEVLGYCVGDTIDAPKRTAFPKDRKQLEAHDKGKEMFKLARAALVKVAAINSGYAAPAKNPDKFCHGFGLYQYDLQFFNEDPDYFLKEKWKDRAGTLSKCVKELKAAAGRTFGAPKKSLSHDESVYVAIAYNKGSANLHKDFKQGYKSDGKYYGENIDDFLKAIEKS